jgi:transcriptional regulator with XRE-family HTH domain
MNTIHTDLVCSPQALYTAMAIPLRAALRDFMPMGHNDRMKHFRKQRGMTQAQFAEKLGVEQPTVQRWEAGKREPSIADLTSAARELGVPVSAFFVENQSMAIGPTLYVKGEVAAGVWKPAVEWPEDDWQTFTGRPDVSAPVGQRFGLRVVGDSMNIPYPPGTIVECVSVFANAEPQPGRRVIVIREDDQGNFEATVKELVEQDGELWLVPRSTNPAHQPMRVGVPEPGIVETRIAAVVVSSYRPEG